MLRRPPGQPPAALQCAARRGQSGGRSGGGPTQPAISRCWYTAHRSA